MADHDLIINTIKECGPVRAKDAVEITGRTRSSIQNTLKSLVNMGYLEIFRYELSTSNWYRLTSKCEPFEDRVFDYVAKSGTASISDICEHLSLTKSMTGRVATDLISDGKLIRHDTRPITYSVNKMTLPLTMKMSDIGSVFA